MLRRLRIKNFKAWKDTGDIRLAPLTVIFGANSGGKSSIGHLMLALQQTAESTDRRRAFFTGDRTSRAELGTFEDCLHNHDRSQALEFELEWELPVPMAVWLDYGTRQRVYGDGLALSTSIRSSDTGQPEVEELMYQLISAKKIALDARQARTNDSGRPFQLSSSIGEHRFVQADGRRWPFEPPEKYYRVADRTISRYKNADFLTDFALATEDVMKSISYLGPLRQRAERTYGWAGNAPPDVGYSGELTVQAILAASGEKRELNRKKGTSYKGFSEFIAEQLHSMGLLEAFALQQIGSSKDYEVVVKTVGSVTQVKLPDIGFGVSQVLPALVQPFYCPPNSTVWMEQPEIHLHPQVQTDLADVMIRAVNASGGIAGSARKPRNVQLIIESHSEHFLRRIQRRIAEGDLERELVAVYFVDRDDQNEARMTPLDVDLFGRILNWPKGFFGSASGEMRAQIEAAAKRQAAHEASAAGGK